MKQLPILMILVSLVLMVGCAASVDHFADGTSVAYSNSFFRIRAERANLKAAHDYCEEKGQQVKKLPPVHKPQYYSYHLAFTCVGKQEDTP